MPLKTPKSKTLKFSPFVYYSYHLKKKTYNLSNFKFFIFLHYVNLVKYRRLMVFSRVVTFACGRGTAKCLTISCDIPRLSRGQHAIIRYSSYKLNYNHQEIQTFLVQTVFFLLFHMSLSLCMSQL